MRHRPPPFITIVPDDYHTPDVGRTEDGRQVFLTGPFVAALQDDPGREFLALYLFDARGRLVEARVSDLGVRADLDMETTSALRSQWLNSLGRTRRCPIKVRPFQLEQFGVRFGLVPEASDEGEGYSRVTVQPGDYIAFTPPWDGNYDT